MSDQPIILYIEDNPDNRTLVHRVLRAEGFEIHSVPDGQEGIIFLNSKTPDLILMEQRPDLVEVPIIALTANVMKGDREKTFEAGCDGYLQKPIDVDKLGDQIRSFIQVGTFNSAGG